MDARIESLYGNRIRIRVCGLCWQDGRLLMVSHRGVAEGAFWAPPGGGLEFGESIHQRLQQEFLEETGLRVSVGTLQFACEFVRKPLHALELFFDVSITGGALRKGQDPELAIIDEVRFLSASEVAAIPVAQLHGVFSRISSLDELKTVRGFLRL